MAGQKISLERGSRGPALVTVVNSSRVYADIKRDIEAARLTGILRTLCCLLRLYFLSFLLFVVRSSNNMHVYVSFVVCFVRLKKFSDITLRIQTTSDSTNRRLATSQPVFCDSFLQNKILCAAFFFLCQVQPSLSSSFAGWLRQPYNHYWTELSRRNLEQYQIKQ